MQLASQIVMLFVLALSVGSVLANTASQKTPLQASASQSVYPLPGALRVNPFARPVKIVAAPTRQVARATAPTANPMLKGVLAAGNDSFANVEGTIVGLGESFGDLKLVGVKDDSATFLRGSSRITLTVSSAPDAGATSAEEASQ